MGKFWALPQMTRGVFAFVIKRATAPGRVGKEGRSLCSPLVHAAHPQAGHLMNWSRSYTAIFPSRLRSAIAWRGHVCVYRSVTHITCNDSPHTSRMLDYEGTLVRIRQGSWSLGAYRLPIRNTKKIVQGRDKYPINGACNRYFISKQSIIPKACFWRRKVQTLCMYTFTVCIPPERNEPNHTSALYHLHVKIITKSNFTFKNPLLFKRRHFYLLKVKKKEREPECLRNKHIKKTTPKVLI